MLYEPAKDTVCLLGWSKNILVLSFRGTASMTNVWADLSVRCGLYTMLVVSIMTGCT